MAALMLFQSTAPVAYAANDTTPLGSSVITSENMDETAPADSDAGYIPETPSDDTNVSDSTDTDSAADTAPSGGNSGKADEPDSSESTDSSLGDTPDSGTDIDPITPDEEQPLPDDEQLPSDEETAQPEQPEESSDKPLFQDGKILIYTCDQLKEIGSGNTVTGEDGTDITYASDAQYAIAENIELTSDMLQWQLPDDFTGSITPLTESSDDLSLYDAQSDTIYLYNPYQLAVLHKESPDTEPVTDGDAQAETFGCGQLIYPNGEGEPYLTYSSTHHYVLSKQFSSDVSVQPYSVTVTEGKADGRNFPGQVIKELGDKTYILIGNEQQLRKIGVKQSNGEYYPVRGAVYQACKASLLSSWEVDTGPDGKPIMLYSGDADLSATDNATRDFTFGEILSASKSFSGLGYMYKREPCGVNQTTGKIDPDLNINEVTNQTYAPNANYIIFRDIDLGSVNWTPLTFHGTMIGAKLGANAAADARLWNDTEITAKEKPVISNVKVVQSGDLDVGKQMGVGFFATISSEVNENDIGLSKGLVKVSNLKIQKISVDNQSTTTKYDQSLINGLVTGLSQVLGGLLDTLLWILSFGNLEAGLRDTLTKVLDARKKDPTALATGAIAGRVEGQVELSDIEVVNVNVKNVNHNTGGFVGYVVGTTQYDGLSNALGGTAKILSKILNVIPGLGLGDLITILLGNVIKLDKLIPIAYINPTIDNCNIEELSLSTSKDKDFVGGFVGKQVGAIISNCAIKKSTFNVVGKDFVGGFVGLCRDSTIKGVLSDVGVAVNNLPKMKPESLLLNCQLNIDSLSVNGESYVGGFTGGLANSSAVNCSAVASKLMDIHATGTYSGGFAGIATLGWAANLGKTDKTDSDLLGSVVKLVEGLLSSNPGEVSSLLSLAGVNPSYILGCTVNAPLTVMGTNYVGGITGWGDGLSIAPSSAEYDDKYGRYPQIVYLVVNCVANSNFSALYASIGNAIDRALGITTSVYQKLIESRRSLGEKAEKVRELVEIFAIGIIILDEIQLIDFQSTKENSFESLMTLTNRTKVAIAVVGTEDAYSKMFTHLRTARRLGNIISGNLYCENRTYFSILAKRVFKYQWFDSPVEMTNDMLEALYRNTHGIIDQLVGLCMYLNLDYISSKSRPTIDADYINKVAKRHYRGIQKLMDELDDPLNEKKRQKIIEEADRKLDNLLQEHKQTAFAEKIMESAEADEKKIPLKKNIIHNIEMVVADYTSDRIAAAVDRVLISTDETDEKVLTRVVMKLLTDSEKETPTKKKKSKKKPLQTSDMVKFIIE